MATKLTLRTEVPVEVEDFVLVLSSLERTALCKLLDSLTFMSMFNKGLDSFECDLIRNIRATLEE